MKDFEFSLNQTTHTETRITMKNHSSTFPINEFGGQIPLTDECGKLNENFTAQAFSMMIFLFFHVDIPIY